MLSPSGKGWGGTCDIQRHTEVAMSLEPDLPQFTCVSK